MPRKRQNHGKAKPAPANKRPKGATHKHQKRSPPVAAGHGGESIVAAGHDTHEGNRAGMTRGGCGTGKFQILVECSHSKSTVLGLPQRRRGHSPRRRGGSPKTVDVEFEKPPPQPPRATRQPTRTPARSADTAVPKPAAPTAGAATAAASEGRGGGPPRDEERGGGPRDERRLRPAPPEEPPPLWGRDEGGTSRRQSNK